MKRTVLVLFLLCLAAFLLVTGGVSLYALQTPDKGNVIVYGSDTCPWCIKQKAYLDEKYIPYTFVDCRTHECPDFVQGFPTTLKDGEVLRGYTEI
jgi:Glutaredoxin